MNENRVSIKLSDANIIVRENTYEKSYNSTDFICVYNYFGRS